MKVRTRKRKNNRKKRMFLSLTLIVTVVLVGCIVNKLYDTFFTKNKVVQATVVDKSNDESNTEGNVKDLESSDKNKDGKVDKDKVVNGKNVNKEGLNHVVDRNEVAKIFSKGYKSDGKKYVFLSFDDGPSNQNTSDVLDILKSKDVKATFFVLGQNIKTKAGAELLKREFNEGHAIGNHSYTHNFKKLYPGNNTNLDYFMQEIHDTSAVMKEVLGDEFDTKVIRMPGGYMSREINKDTNLTSVNNIFSKEGITNIDWNCENLDAKGKKYSNQDMLNYAMKTSEGKDKVVILMHDAQGKVQTKQILPQVIDYFKSKGYEFKTIS